MNPIPLIKHPARGVLFFLLTLTLALPQMEVVGQSWDRDQVLNAEGYQTPPDNIAEAVLAPRHLNVTLSSANADKTLSRLDEQATLLRQGLYLDRGGKIKPLSPDHLKQAKDNPPPPPPALPDQKVRPAKTTPIVLTVPKS